MDKLLYVKGTSNHQLKKYPYAQGAKHINGHIKPFNLSSQPPSSSLSSLTLSSLSTLSACNQPFCNYCKRPGHLIKVCHHKLANEEWVNIAKEVILALPTNKPDIVAFIITKPALTFTTANPYTSIWYLDSGATLHMAANCNWFLNYKPL